MVGGIYKIENAVNGRCYIGSAVHLVNRWATHRRGLRNGEHRNRYLQRAWDKYGEAAFSFAVLEAVADPVYLVAREQAHIDEWGARDKLYNLAPKAESTLGTTRTAASKAKASASNLGQTRSDEARAAMSKAQKRSNAANPELKAMRAEQLVAARQSVDRQKQREAARIASGNRVWSDESRAKLSASCMGRKLTPETRAKISATKLKGSVLHG
jgi:group I intron endonuclease